MPDPIANSRARMLLSTYQWVKILLAVVSGSMLVYLDHPLLHLTLQETIACSIWVMVFLGMCTQRLPLGLVWASLSIAAAFILLNALLVGGSWSVPVANGLSCLFCLASAHVDWGVPSETELRKHLDDRIEGTPRNRITFAVDYDGTWTTDPAVFVVLTSLLRSRGHRVIVVTARVSGRTEVESAVGLHVDRLVFAGVTTKREACSHLGERVNVWIDDRPGLIGPEPTPPDPWGDAERAAKNIDNGGDS